MKQKTPTQGGRLSIWILASLVVLLAILAAATIIMILTGVSVQTGDSFDLERITARETADDSDVSSLLIPALIGITADGSRYASSVSAATTSELYRTVIGAAAEVLGTTGTADESEKLWESLVQRSCSVYIRFHHEIPDYLICALSGDESASGVSSQVYEMFLLPYSESSDSVTAAVRNYSGDVTVYTKKSPVNILTEDELSQILGSYLSALSEFEFTDNLEPVFTSSLTSRNIIITNGTASMLRNSSDESDELLRLFSLNPDKLLNSHISPDGTASYIDQRGIFYIRPSSFAYSAAQDGGISIENYADFQSSPALIDYIRAANTVFKRIGEINQHFTGSDCDIMLASAEASDGKVTLIFEYIFDNIRIIDLEPAFRVTFENGRLTEAELYTISVRNLGTRSQSIAEWWFADYLEADDSIGVRNISLVYRCDFISESVKAQWCGEEYTRKEN